MFRSVIFICYRGCRPNIPSIQLQAVSKARAVCRYISVGEMQGFSIATGNFGAKGITLISKNTQRIVKSIRKKTPGKVCSHRTLPRLRRTGQPSSCKGVMPLRRLPVQSGHFRI